MFSKRVLVTLGGVGTTLTLIVACSVGDVDFSNKACPCGPEYTCDSNRNVCVPNGTLVRPEGGGNACVGDACPCSADSDCSDPTRTQCSPSKICVECLAATDHCRSGSYCNDANQCVLGCKQESDCQISPSAPHCDLTRHQCVACRTIDDCVNAEQCSPSGECVEGCDLDMGKLCSGGKQCCNKLCIDTTKDALNCGSCGLACSTENGTPTCASSVCTWTCASGFTHCADGNTGCETNTRSDALNCGSCGRDCHPLVGNATNITCAAGLCEFEACTANHDDCDANRENGCECSCGTRKTERCCPGNVCNATLTCNAAANKCN